LTIFLPVTEAKCDPLSMVNSLHIKFYKKVVHPPLLMKFVMKFYQSILVKQHHMKVDRRKANCKCI